MARDVAFVSDLKEIRRRAREHIESGAVTAGDLLLAAVPAGWGSIPGDDSRADAHVLENLVAAFTARPNGIPQRHDSDIKAGQLCLFGLDFPQLVLDLDPIQMKWLVRHHLQLQTGKFLREASERRLDLL